MLSQHLLLKLSQDIALDPSLQPLHNQLNKLMKVIKSSFCQAAIQERELAELRKAAESRAIKTSQRCNYIQDGGLLRVERALELIEQKEAKAKEHEDKRQQRTAKRAGATQQQGDNGQS